MKRKNKKIDEHMVLKGGYIPSKIINVHEHLQEINRGTYYHKGYNRNKEKNLNRGDYEC